jgi:DNA-directed RNA polymerase subunit alpha
MFTVSLNYPDGYFTIEQLGLSIKGYNALKRAGINSVDDLQKKSKEDLLSLKHFTTKQLRELNQQLKEKGFELEF